MPDLIDLFEDLREHPPAGPRPLEDIERRARVLRRQRQTRKLAVIPALAAVVALSVVRLTTRSRSEHVITGPTATTQPNPGLAALPVKMIPGPPGWQPVDYGNARVWVPPDWSILPTGVSECATLVKVVLLNPPTTVCNSPRTPVSAVTIWPIGSVDETGPSRTINGYRVLVPSITPTFYIPRLSVRITIQTTSDAQRQTILATLGPSSRAAVLAPGPTGPPPRDWKAASYGPITVRVPPSWPVENIDAAQGFDVCRVIFHTPAVVLGSPSVMPPCPMGGVRLPGDGVWLRTTSAAIYGLPGAFSPLTTSTGLHVEVLNGNDSFLVAVEVQTVEVTLGVGFDPTIARTILYSLASTEKAPTANPCAAQPLPLDPSRVPTDVTRWATGRRVIGAGSLWTVSSAISVAPTFQQGFWTLKFPWYTRPAGLPTIAASRIGGGGTFKADASLATDSTGTWSASLLRFSGGGCWQVTGTYHDSTLTFGINVPSG
jgi:hypothetical protein